jgi:hypothetical protein
MRIDAVVTEFSSEFRGKKSLKASTAGSFAQELKKAQKDSYQPSPVDPQSRNLAIDSIKAKIKAGYYTRDSVMEDVSDKLAKLFNKD